MIIKNTKKTKAARNRKGRYKTGIYVSKKSNLPIKYRSSWEYYVCCHLDNDPDVVQYFYEQIKIPYIANIKSGKVRIYYPDFLIFYKNGDKKLVEVKRKNQVNNFKVVKKAEAAKKWAEKYNVEYLFWTEEIIKPIMKLYAPKKPKKQKATKKKPSKKTKK
jgi:hypothetical protein